MGQDLLPKEDYGEFLDQRVHVVTTTQELWNRTRNSVRFFGDYLINKGPINWAMATWIWNIDRFEWKYDKAFAGINFFGMYIIDRIKKTVQVFLKLCNMKFWYNMDTRALLEFQKIQQRVEWGKWITYTPAWIEFPILKEDGRRKLENGRGETTEQTYRKAET